MRGCSNKEVGELITLYESDALEHDQRAVFLDHLIDCEYCYDQVYSMEPIMAAFRGHRAAARREKLGQAFTPIRQVAPVSKPRRSWLPLPLAAALAMLLIVFAGSLYLFLPERQTDGALVGEVSGPHSGGESGGSLRQNIEIPKPPYTAPSDHVVLRKPKTKAFDSAMSAYERGDYAAAIEQLETLSELETYDAADVKFYLGVSLLLAGRSQDAIKTLKQAVELSTGPLLESSHYYLSLAYIKSDQPQQALAELDAVIASAGEHQSDAERLKRQVAETMK